MTDATIGLHASASGPRDEGAGTTIGPYRLLRLIGEGGFGDVYEAQQSEPVQRRVALKLVKLGMDTREVIARFELERQALAVMEHPHIARVFDAGSTPSGRPYFVMEYVDGVPVSEFCASRRMPVDSILALFAQVCVAIQHAHLKGVIHRDLKPGNILVGVHDGQPFAKVIDFGIAKATGGEAGERALATRIDQVMGTPLYMSPEQATGSPDIDTRTDIFSLGVILYELLTGTTPVERERLQAASLVDSQRLILEYDPPRPSDRVLRNATTVSGSATFRPLDPHRLARLLRGDLDWIVMKALEKEPARRYQSAADLAQDLQHYLAGETVSAVPPTRRYRLRKFVRRHKVAVVAGSLVAASLLVGLTAFAWQWRVAAERADDLSRVTAFDSEMFEKIDPAVAGDSLTADVRSRFEASLRRSSMAAEERAQRLARFDADWQRVDATDAAVAVIGRNVLKPVADSLDERFASRPDMAGPLRMALANRYQTIGMYEPAIAQMRIALDLQRKVAGADDPALADYQFAMGSLLQQSGHGAEAEPYYLGVLKTIQRRHGDTPTQGGLTVLANLGVLYAAQGDAARAEPIYRQVLVGRRRLLGNEDPDTLLSLVQIGAFMRGLHRYAEARTYLTEAERGFARARAPDVDNALYAQGNLALLLEAEGNPEAAIRTMRDTVARSRRLQGADHPTTLLTQVVLGGLLSRRGEHAEVERLLAPIRTSVRAVWRNDDAFWYGSLLAHLGQARAARGAYAEAESDLLEGEALLAKPHMPEEPDDLRGCRQGLIALYRSWDRAEPGHGHAAQANDWQRRLAPPGAASKS